ncbi:lactate utilization protein C [Rubrobacter marinus]|uniref:Lactate utilization protein C n=1 Tax=Rubrobacter marinus TaxID=2653852 RepID=A0A6G8PWJ9_9ACTN|nr:lactate utilization protein [Rubrobacter marinus]QIN78582.1 lactate utilization protein C [Rubrobacter marinus]
MADRARFLENVRHRTRTGRYKPTRAPDSVWTPKGAPVPDPIADPVARFLEELGAVGGHGARVQSLDEARDHVVSLARERGAGALVRWDDEELAGFDAPLAGAGVEVAIWRDLEDFRAVAGLADVGLSTASWAIAETGSLVLESGPGRGRSVTLLPPTYVAVLRAERVLGTVAEAVGKYAGGRLPANVCFHTGPSRSGDIEMSLVTGMHGPGDVHVVVVG